MQEEKAAKTAQKTAMELHWDSRETILTELVTHYIDYDRSGTRFTSHVKTLRDCPRNGMLDRLKIDKTQTEIVRDLSFNDSHIVNFRLRYLCAVMTDYDTTELKSLGHFTKLKDVLDEAYQPKYKKFTDEKFKDCVVAICRLDEPQDEEAMKKAASSYDQHRYYHLNKIYHAANEIINHATVKSEEARLSKLRGFIGEICLIGMKKPEELLVNEEGALLKKTKTPETIKPIID